MLMIYETFLIRGKESYLVKLIDFLFSDKKPYVYKGAKLRSSDETSSVHSRPYVAQTLKSTRCDHNLTAGPLACGI